MVETSFVEKIKSVSLTNRLQIPQTDKERKCRAVSTKRGKRVIAIHVDFAKYALPRLPVNYHRTIYVQESEGSALIIAS